MMHGHGEHDAWALAHDARARAHDARALAGLSQYFLAHNPQALAGLSQYFLEHRVVSYPCVIMFSLV